jgi:hypothetical protein
VYRAISCAHEPIGPTDKRTNEQSSKVVVNPLNTLTHPTLNKLYTQTPVVQIKELSEASSQRAAEAAAVRSAAAAEAASQQLLLALSTAESAAQEKLQDLLRCIEDVAAQVCCFLGFGGAGFGFFWGGGLLFGSGSGVAWCGFSGGGVNDLVLGGLLGWPIST